MSAGDDPMTLIDNDELDALLREAKRTAWAEGCRKGLSVNPGWDEVTLAGNPYGTAEDRKRPDGWSGIWAPEVPR